MKGGERDLRSTRRLTPVVSRSLLVPADVYERLREYAEANRLSVAQVMNEALRRYAEEVEKVTEDKRVDK